MDLAKNLDRRRLVYVSLTLSLGLILMFITHDLSHGFNLYEIKTRQTSFHDAILFFGVFSCLNANTRSPLGILSYKSSICGCL